MHHSARWLTGVALLTTAGCTGTPEDSTRVDRRPDLAVEGAGATFPYPLYTRWFSHFAEGGDARINYRSIGSGAGVSALLADSADFAASDAPLDSTQRRQLTTRGVRQVPLVVGGAAVTYNVPSLTRQLRLDAPTLAAIFLGEIRRWDDPRIVSLNPDAALPAQPLRVITRADSSGTSWILTDYLTRTSTTWASRVGRSRYPAWPVGSPARGNEGVAGELKATEFSIGVVEAVYAMHNRLPVARMRNHAGAWVTPQTGALRSAAEAMLGSIDDTLEFATSISDPPGASSYPIASLSWLIVPSRGGDAAKLAAVERFVRWALEQGDDDALALGYAPLPDAMRTRLLRALPAAAVTARR
ncbi:MAG: phosphate ABC transporter substrate-binding protein PstS [Gemmatimonadaceae bacterium]|nr:phosphate ABC transporter substrate-binding protein PstS [Gemmatimonadaceae bacterium]